MAEQKVKEYQLVVFSIGNEDFGVEIGQVREIVRLIQITYLPKAPIFIEGVVNLRGQVLPIMDLAKRLGIESHPRTEATRIIVVDVENNRVWIVVDSVSEVLRLSSDDVDDVPMLVDTEVPEHYIRGIGKLKDRLLVLLDLNKILTAEEVQHVERHIKDISEGEKKQE